jgi:ribose 5-phosphate isomerase B
MDTLFIGCDHGGFEMKQQILHFIENISTETSIYDKETVAKIKNIKLKDFGCFDTKSVNYPDYAEKVCTAVIESNFEFPLQSSYASTDALDFPAMGLLICGSGQGMALKANKYPNIRAALVWSDEITKLSREHNNANVLCLPGRFISAEHGFQFLVSFLTTHFAQGRHSQRVEKINL